MTKDRLRGDFREASLPPLCAPEAGRAGPQGAQGLRVRTRRRSTTPPCITRVTWPGDSPDASTRIRGTERSPASRLWLFTRAGDSRKPHLPPGRRHSCRAVGNRDALPVTGRRRLSPASRHPILTEGEGKRRAEEHAPRQTPGVAPTPTRGRSPLGTRDGAGRPPGLPAAAGPRRSSASPGSQPRRHRQTFIPLPDLPVLKKRTQSCARRH